MPTISLTCKSLFELLKREYSDDEFADLCFDYGLELDEVTSEQELSLKEKGVADNIQSTDTLYKVETPANRYDLLCMEGLVYSLLIFQNKMSIPRLIASDIGPKREKMVVKQPTKIIRPYIVCAILRDFEFPNQAAYASFIDYQDRLHQTIARKRTLVSMGTHDYDTIKGPFYYDAKPPHEINFVPLNQTKSYRADELMDLYNKESHLRPYLNIIKDSPVYPIIYDSNGTVLSFPPIINSEHSKITLKTKNIFIECTATDLHKAKVTVECLTGLFSRYCKMPYHVETVEIISEENPRNRFTFPEFNYRKEALNVEDANKLIGIKITADQTRDCLKRMGYVVHDNTTKDNKIIHLEIPPLRSDVLHVRDVIEDVAIAYGYNNIKPTYPNMSTIANQLPLNKFSETLREEIVAMGYTEVLTFSLCSKDDVYTKLRRNPNMDNACVIANPKTADFQVVRTSLLPGILKVIACNKNVALPLKLFEISDVCFKDPNADTLSVNNRRACVLRYAKTGGSGFEIIHGVLDRLMQLVGCRRIALPSENPDISNVVKPKAKSDEIMNGGNSVHLQPPSNGLSNLSDIREALLDERDKEDTVIPDKFYFIQPISDPTYFDGRCAGIYLHKNLQYNLETKHNLIGTFGIVHPEVIKNFDLHLPCSALEIDLDALMKYVYY